jgi:hypothetical protein
MSAFVPGGSTCRDFRNSIGASCSTLVRCSKGVSLLERLARVRMLKRFLLLVSATDP